MRIYIAGQMTDLEDYNYPAFNEAAERLRVRGHDAVNPAESEIDPDAEWHLHLRNAIGLLVTCDTIVLLHGWHRSKGARLEHHIALELGMAVLTLAEALEEDVVAA